jgi:hypothetical protein
MLSKEGILGKFRGGAGQDSKSHRSSLPKEIAASLREQFSSLAGQDLDGYTCEQERSHQKGAKNDIRIYDAAGELRYEGRSFGGSAGISFWKPGTV